MVGLIHRILFDLIETTAGAEAVAEVKRRSGVPQEKEFCLSMAYEDAEWRRLFQSTCEVLDVTQEQAETAYADVFYRDSLTRWPTWFEMAKTSREFLWRQPAIHNSFATGIRDPNLQSQIRDKFEVEDRGAELVVHYRSPNHLCGIYIQLANRILRHYGDKAKISERRCSKRGDPACEIHVAYTSAAKQTS